MRRHKTRAHRRIFVEAFGERPLRHRSCLACFTLPVASGDVVATRVRRHVVEGVFLLHVLGVFAEDEAELPFVVALVLGDLGDRHVGVVVVDAGRAFDEDRGTVWEGATAF